MTIWVSSFDGKRWPEPQLEDNQKSPSWGSQAHLGSLTHLRIPGARPACALKVISKVIIYYIYYYIFTISDRKNIWSYGREPLTKLTLAPAFADLPLGHLEVSTQSCAESNHSDRTVILHPFNNQPTVIGGKHWKRYLRCSRAQPGGRAGERGSATGTWWWEAGFWALGTRHLYAGAEVNFCRRGTTGASHGKSKEEFQSPDECGDKCPPACNIGTYAIKRK